MFLDNCDFEKGCFETPRLLENRGNKDPITGYRNISLRLKTGGRKAEKLHRAVYLAKYKKITKGMHIMHLDGNPENCALSNLQEGTPSMNNLMKKHHGKTTIPNTKVPVTAIFEDKTKKEYCSFSEAARELGLIAATIGKIIDTREKNKYYKNTYTSDGRKVTFKKNVLSA